MSKYFPVNNGVRRGDGVSLLIAIAIYIVVPAVLGVVSRILWWIPVIGWALGIVSTLVGLYCLVGIILAILKFLK